MEMEFVDNIRYISEVDGGLPCGLNCIRNLINILTALMWLTIELVVKTLTS